MHTMLILLNQAVEITPVRIDLDGYSTDFDLIQQGSTDQNYNIDMTCGTQSGCSVSTTQGN